MNKIRFNTNLMPDTMKKLELMAKANGLNINQVIDYIVSKQKKVKLY